MTLLPAKGSIGVRRCEDHHSVPPNGNSANGPKIIFIIYSGEDSEIRSRPERAASFLFSLKKEKTRFLGLVFIEIISQLELTAVLQQPFGNALQKPHSANYR